MKFLLIPVYLFLPILFLAQDLIIYKNNTNLYGYRKANTNDVVISPKFDMAWNFGAEGLALVKKDLKYGFIDKTGKEVIPLKWDYAESFSEGVALVSIKGKLYGFIDKTGKEVIPITFESAFSFKKGFAVVGKNRLFTYINKSGKEIGPYKYTYTLYFDEDAEGLAAVAVIDANDPARYRWGLIDKNGKEIVPLKYLYQLKFFEGIAVGMLDIGTNAICVYVDLNGKEISQEYKLCSNFKDGLGMVMRGEGLNAKYGFVDKTGKEVIPLKYNMASEPNGGLAKVGLLKGGIIKQVRYGMVDATGKEIIDMDHDDIQYDPINGVFVASKGSKLVYYNKEGQRLKDYMPKPK